MFMEIDIFIPCFIDLMYPDTAFNMIKVLEKTGCKINYNTNQTCCGQPAYNAGYKNEAFKLARKFMNDFSGDRYIVTPSASCAGMIKKSYEDFFNSSAKRNHFMKIREKTYEFSTFLTDVMNVENVGAVFSSRVTYHDSCSALRGLKIKNGPRKLLMNVRGLELVEMEESETCCGFGGTFAVKMEPISSAMADQKVTNALKTGAEYIIGTDTSCLMHLDAYARKNNKNIKTMHLADILAQGY